MTNQEILMEVIIKHHLRKFTSNSIAALCDMPKRTIQCALVEMAENGKIAYVSRKIRGKSNMANVYGLIEDKPAYKSPDWMNIWGNLGLYWGDKLRAFKF